MFILLALTHFEIDALRSVVSVCWLNNRCRLGAVGSCLLLRFVVVDDVKLNGLLDISVFAFRLSFFIVVDGLSRCFRLIAIVIGDREFHPVCDVSHRIHNLSDDDDGFRGKICEESQGHDDEHRYEPWTADETLEPLTYKLSVTSTGIENAVGHKRGEQFGECHRRPHHP